MTNLTTELNISGDSVHLSVPFSKVDKQRRMVHGFATLDNLDSQDDIVKYEASVKAFETFRGNIREMHTPKAVGKMISFRPEQVFVKDMGKSYKGIFVSAYVSKGAQDTWEKVIDETLTGFSIGGHIIKSSTVFDEDLDKVVRVVEDYEITELSLVDNPANNLANIVSFEKGVDGGYLTKTKTENVFFCRLHNVVQFSSTSHAECHQCGANMTNIGFVETDDPEKISVIKSMVANVRNAAAVGDMVDFDEGFGRVESVASDGDVFLPEDNEIYKGTELDPIAIIRVYEKNNDTIVETDRRIIKNLSSITKMKEVERVANEVEETVEPAVEETVVEEVKAEETEPEVESTTVPSDEVITKSEDTGLAEIKEMLTELTKALSALPDAIGSIAGIAKEAKDSAEEAQQVAKSATAELTKVKAEKEELGARIEAVEGSTAFRKSADVGDVVQTAPEVQSIWGGRFLDVPTKTTR